MKTFYPIIFRFFCAGIILANSTRAFSGIHPNMYINAIEIAAIKAKVQAGQQPWKAAYDQMISAANAALTSGPYTITKGNLSGGSVHDYYTEPPYAGWSRPSPYGDGKLPDGRDGKVNPGADRDDYAQAGNFGDAVRNLGFAYAFTGNTAYANRAIYFMRVWCIDAATKMNPKFTGGQSRIELYITIPKMFYGADLLYNYSGWNSADKAAILSWVSSLCASSRVDYYNPSAGPNNFENWRCNFIASAGALTDDFAQLAFAFNRYKEIIPLQMDSQGKMIRELSRTKSLDYSLYAIHAMMGTAEVARHRGTDLYTYTTGGKGLKHALDFHAYYAAHPDRWVSDTGCRQISALSASDSVGMYELAYSFWKQQSYLDVINHWGRPMKDVYLLGNACITLSHANRFALDRARAVSR